MIDHKMQDASGRNLNHTNLAFRGRQIEGVDGDTENNPLTWEPVCNWKKRRSPQSQKAHKDMKAYFGENCEAAWEAGWRWCWKTNVHSWYPPKEDVDNGTIADLKSTQVRATLIKLDSPLTSEDEWAKHIADVTADEVVREAARKEKAALKKAAKAAA